MYYNILDTRADIQDEDGLCHKREIFLERILCRLTSYGLEGIFISELWPYCLFWTCRRRGRSFW